MNAPIVLAMTCLLLAPRAAAAQQLSSEMQIASALLAAPEDRRSGAKVLSWEGKGPAVTLREGTNELICIGNNPNPETRDSSMQKIPFSVACYHKDLEPFMARGRELTESGMKQDNLRDQTRAKEIDAGTLPFPKEPRMLYVLEAQGFDTATGQAIEPYLRYVVYVAYATAASTGMPVKPAPGVPWLMYPGQAGAHIMISPPRPAAR
jgi:hypothetical protein